MGKTEIDVSDIEGEAMLRMAEMTSERDYLGLELIGRSRGFRLGEIFGVKKRTKYHVWIDVQGRTKREAARAGVPFVAARKDTRISNTDIPGLYVEDLRDGQIWVKRKGGKISRVDLPEEFYKRLAQFARGKKGKLFDFRERQGYNLVQKYAQLSGMKDWALMHPHRWRHYYITRAIDKYTLTGGQHLAGHASWRTTLRYAAKPTPEKLKGMVEGMTSSEKGGQSS